MTAALRLASLALYCPSQDELGTAALPVLITFCIPPVVQSSSLSQISGFLLKRCLHTQAHRWLLIFLNDFAEVGEVVVVGGRGRGVAFMCVCTENLWMHLRARASFTQESEKRGQEEVRPMTFHYSFRGKRAGWKDQVEIAKGQEKTVNELQQQQGSNWEDSVQ